VTFLSQEATCIPTFSGAGGIPVKDFQEGEEKIINNTDFIVADRQKFGVQYKSPLEE